MANYLVTYEYEAVIEVEDGHDLSEEEIKRVLNDCLIDDVRNDPHRGLIDSFKTELPPDYKIKTVIFNHGYRHPTYEVLETYDP